MKYKALGKDDELMVGDEFRRGSGPWDLVDVGFDQMWIGCTYRRPVPDGWIPVSEAKKYATKLQTVLFTNFPILAKDSMRDCWTGFFTTNLEPFGIPETHASTPTHFQVLSWEIVEDSDAKFQAFYKSEIGDSADIDCENALRKAFQAGMEAGK